MAKRVAPSRHQADNSAGNFTSAACNDWPDVRRFHVGTDHSESTPDAGYTTACASSAILSINFLAFRGSPYRNVRSPIRVQQWTSNGMKQRRFPTKKSMVFHSSKPLKYSVMTTHRASTTPTIRPMRIDTCSLVFPQKEISSLCRIPKDQTQFVSFQRGA